MGSLKIELNIPDFKETLEMSIILKKDGSQIYATTKTQERPVWKQEAEIPQSPEIPKIPTAIPQGRNAQGNNLMGFNMDF